MSKICSNCGHENRDVAIFCGNCGSRLVAQNFSTNLRGNSSSNSSTNSSSNSSTTTAKPAGANSGSDDLGAVCCGVLIILFVIILIMSIG